MNLQKLPLRIIHKKPPEANFKYTPFQTFNGETPEGFDKVDLEEAIKIQIIKFLREEEILHPGFDSLQVGRGGYPRKDIVDFILPLHNRKF